MGEPIELIDGRFYWVRDQGHWRVMLWDSGVGFWDPSDYEVRPSAIFGPLEPPPEPSPLDAKEGGR